MEGEEKMRRDLGTSGWRLKSHLKGRRPDTVVVAACSPREHETTFKNVMKQAGKNPFLLQIANIREQVAWVTRDPSKATSKAAKCIKAALARVNTHVCVLQGLSVILLRRSWTCMTSLEAHKL